MPPEQWSWDRKEAFFRDRKHERSEPLGFPHHGGPRDFYRWGPPEFRRPPGDRKELFFKDRRYERFEPIGPPPPPARWRDSYHHNNYPRNFNRWGGSPEFRRPPGGGGFGKQGGWHMFPEESGNGYGPSRSSERNFEGDGFRPYGYRGNGRYSGRNGRENRPFSQRDVRGGNSLETTKASPSPSGKPIVNSAPTNSSHPDSGSEKNGKSNLVHSKDQQQDKSGGGANGLSTCQNSDKENRELSPVSTDWKPLKWTRSGSFSSRGLGLNHSSCTKDIGGGDLKEAKASSQGQNANPVQSPSGDPTTCLASDIPAEETILQRKQRLGWGEGLAKYEKKKVEGTDESENNGCVASTNVEPVHSVFSNLAEKSPRMAEPSDCASPATPSSVACSSSSGLDKKSNVKSLNADNDLSNSCGSLGPVSQNVEGFSFELERLDSTVHNLGSTLIELLQSDQTVSVDSNFVRSTAMNKLLVLKGDILKDLEVTESRVDSLENELKSIMVDNYCFPVLADNIKSDGEQRTAADAIPCSASLQIASSADAGVDKRPLFNVPQQGIHSDRKEEDVDSPGSATSKFIEHVYTRNAVSSSDIPKVKDCSGSLSAMSPNIVEAKVFASLSSGGGISPSADRECMHPETDNGGPASDDTCKEDDLYKLILASNKELADEASEEFFNLVPKDLRKSYMTKSDDLSFLQNVSAIREKLMVKKRCQRFKEKLLAIKFQTLHHLWKHDLGLPPLKKSHAKSQKKIELGLRTMQSGFQKRRSSIRSPTTSLARTLALVPTSEVINITRKLVLDSQPQISRTSLKMPVLILDKERAASMFISTNGLIEDPFAVERERDVINIWTSEEKELFMDKLAILGKNFRKIASFLDHKTTADCVQFYYKNHKSDCFVKTKKSGRKQVKSSASAYMLTSQKRLDREMNAASLDMLGTVSMIASGSDDSAFKQPFRARLFFGRCSESKATQVDDSIFGQLISSGNLGNERESVAADVLAGMSGSFSSEAMSSCVTSSVNLPKNRRSINQKTGTKKRPWTPGVEQIVDETGSDESCEEMGCEDWTDRERLVFIQGITSYGKDFSAISRLIQTKSRKQCKVYFSKARKCLRLDSLWSGRGVIKSTASDDAEDSKSDVDDVCAGEAGVAVYHDSMGFKSENEMVTSPMDAKHFGTGHVKKIKVEDVKLIEDNRIDRAGHRDGEGVETLVTNPCQLKDKTNIVYDCPKRSKALCSEKKVDSLVNSGAGKDQQFNKGRLVAESSTFNETTGPDVSSSDSVNVVNKTGTEGTGNGGNASESLVFENHTKESRDETSNIDARSPCLQGPLKEPSTIKHSPETRSRQEHHQLQVIPEFSTVEQHAASSQNESSFASGNSLPQYSGMPGGENINIPDRLSSTLGQHESKDEELHNVSGGSEKQGCSESPCHHQAESSNILPSNPLQSPTESKVNGDFSIERAEVHSLVKYKRSFNNQSSAKDSCLKRCGKSKYHSATSDRARYQIYEQTSGESPPLRSSSDSEKLSRVRDVRLFGTLLREEPSTEVQKSDETVINQPRPSKSCKSKSAIGEENGDGNSAILKSDQNNYIASGNLPTTDYGYWNRLQPCFSTMPDSATLRSDFPAPFCNAVRLPSQSQQQSVGSSSGRFNGVYSREMNGNRAVDLIYRGRDGSTETQPFKVDMAQCEDMYPEIQRYNGLNVMSALQQNGSGAVGRDVLSRVGACPTVQDPVTAARMQYAKADQYGGQAGGGIIREEPAWRGKGM